MIMYDKLPEDIKNRAVSYMKSGEVQDVTKPVLYKGREYFAIVYRKKLLGIKTNNVQGRLIMDSEGGVVEDKTMLKELSRLFYYYGLFFENQGMNLKGALKGEEDMEKELREYAQASVALDYLASKDVYGAGEVKRIIDGYPAMKTEANNVLKEVITKAEDYASKGITFSEEVLNDIFSYYKKAVLMNFEEVKFINTASSYYDALRDQAVKMRRTMGISMNVKFKNAAAKLEIILSFFINIIKFYGDFLNYSPERYWSKMQERDDNNINEYLKSLRN